MCFGTPAFRRSRFNVRHGWGLDCHLAAPGPDIQYFQSFEPGPNGRVDPPVPTAAIRSPLRFGYTRPYLPRGANPRVYRLASETSSQPGVRASGWIRTTESGVMSPEPDSSGVTGLGGPGPHSADKGPGPERRFIGEPYSTEPLNPGFPVTLPELRNHYQAVPDYCARSRGHNLFSRSRLDDVPPSHPYFVGECAHRTFPVRVRELGYCSRASISTQPRFAFGSLLGKVE
jgi:hypothetical protein